MGTPHFFRQRWHGIIINLDKDPKGYISWEQKSILKQYGLKGWEIKRLKNEELRTEKILELQKSKNKIYRPRKEDKPLSKEEKKSKNKKEFDKMFNN